MKPVFTIIMFICYSTLTQSIIMDVRYTTIGALKAVAKIDPTWFPEAVNHLIRLSCENEPNSLDFNESISNIDQDFISNPLITCLNLTDNNIENIKRGAFNQLPNLTHLFLSNNRFDTSKLLNFGGHYNLQVLIVNSAVRNPDQSEAVQIFGEYPNLEMLSLRQNSFYDLHFSSEETPFCEVLSACTTVSTITQKIPFPKLEILDLSENNIRGTDFLKLLPNSLYFLDLHNNGLESFDLNTADKLIILNLNNNHFNCISNQFQVKQCLSVTGLKDLHYLSVSTNNIRRIEPTAFRDNNRLVRLNLSVNNINYLHPETFANLQYLKTLDLSQNELENVPQISNEIEITSLYINNNNITKLTSNIFAQMPKLMDLWLGGNQINEIDVEAFANLSILWELDLSRNKLSFLPEGWTKSLVSLRVMDLSDNQFTSLESLSLTNAPRSLVEIFLMRTPLKYLNVRSLPQDLIINFTNMSRFTWMKMMEETRQGGESKGERKRREEVNE